MEYATLRRIRLLYATLSVLAVLLLLGMLGLPSLAPWAYGCMVLAVSMLLGDIVYEQWHRSRTTFWAALMFGSLFAIFLWLVLT
jgi:hypothetical protein